MWLKFENKILKIVRVMVRAGLKKRVSRKTHLKFWVEYERRPARLRKNAKLNRKKNFPCMKSFASYSRRFKLNFKPKKNRFSENLHWCCPLRSTDDTQRKRSLPACGAAAKLHFIQPRRAAKKPPEKGSAPRPRGGISPPRPPTRAFTPLAPLP